MMNIMTGMEVAMQRSLLVSKIKYAKHVSM